jgi:bis(5'-nucleosidyl)-tetraphosphatase
VAVTRSKKHRRASTSTLTSTLTSATASPRASTAPTEVETATTQTGSPALKPRRKKPPAKGLPHVLSCGVLLRQRRPIDAILALVRHDGSPDLPKGHVKAGEDDLAAALREFEEETGIARDRIAVDAGRTFESTYRTRAKKTGRMVNKTVRIFLAEIEGPAVVHVVDHGDYAWLRTNDWPGLEAALVDNPTFLGAVRALLPHLQRSTRRHD